MTPGDKRRAGINWTIGDGKSNLVSSSDAALAVLMDIRDELKVLNRLLHCTNFQAIPFKLDAIRKGTNRIPPRKRKYVRRTP